MRSILLKLAVAASLALAFACGGGSKDTSVAVQSVDLQPTLVINQGSTGQLTATLTPENATNKEVSWSSSNGNATVPANATGLTVTVTGALVGDSVVRVTTKDGNKTDTCNVKVVPQGAVTGVTMQTALAVVIGTPATLTATVNPASATNKNVTWSSSDQAVATVAGNSANQSATVTGLTPGNCTITVTTADGGHQAHCLVTVSAPVVPVTGVSLNTTSTNLALGGSLTLTATVAPSTATNQALTWSNSNNAAATISATTGASITVTPVAVGNTTVTVRSQADSTKTASCSITVVAANVPVSSVTLPGTLNVAAGATAQLTAVIAPSTATNQAVTWTSSNTTVATVTGTGLTVTVNGLSGGSSTIRCTSQADNTKFGECVVTVASANVPVTSVTVAPTTLSLNVGGSAGSLTATVNPSNATNRNVTWSIAPATGVATLSATTGATVNVTPTGQGNATITVTSAADSTKTDTCQVTVGAAATVTKLTLPKTLVVKSGGQAKLTVDITPWNAGNRNITWTTSNSAIAAVTGTGAVATVTGGATTGIARITATSAGSPTVSDYCDVTVAASLLQEVYIGGNFGMVKNDVEESAYSDTPIYSVTAGPDGVVHAVGYHEDGGIFYPTYYRDGVRTHLPMSPGMDEGVGMAIHVTPDNHVYIAGYESDGGQVSAKLWVDGVNTPLAGASEYIYVQATGVYVSGGNVYVSGLQSEDGQYYNHPALWINGAKTNYTALGYRLAAHSVVALGPDVYVGGGFGVIKLNPATPAAYTVVPGYATDHEWGMEVLELRLVGEDIYAAGWDGEDPVQWKNHVATVLDWPDPTDSYGEAHGISVAQDGTIHAAGHSLWSFWGYYFYTPGWWVNGSLRPVSTFTSGTGYATRTVFVKESVGVAVTSVSVAPTTLAVPVGFAGQLTATVLPSNASNKNLTWTSSNEAVASVTGTGPTVTINGVSLGGPVTITARSADNNAAFATCTVNVVTVNVASVSLPPTFIVGVNRTGRLTATVTPLEATNTAATWSTSAPGIATVTGTGLVGTVAGVALGNATITITTQDGNKVAQCVVTVADIVDPVIHVAGDFGLYSDGVFDTLINGEDIAAVAADGSNNVYAAGWYYDTAAEPHWKAAYYRNGVRSILPIAPEAVEGGAFGVDISPTNQVYIAGYELTGENYDQTAKLWLNGVSQTLQGTDDHIDGELLWTFARVVRVHGGSVYVAGSSEDESFSSYATIWKDGVKHRIPGLLGTITHMGITTSGTIYAIAGSSLVRIPATLASYETIDLPSGGYLMGMCVDGNDFHVVAWYGNEGYYWKNAEAPLELPRPPGSSWAEADAVYVAGGHVYIAGLVSMDGYYIPVWKDGEMIPLDDDLAIKDRFVGSYSDFRPAAIFAK